MARVILASSSERRKDLLKQIGIEPEVIPSNIDEKAESTDPADIVEEVSSNKAQAVAEGLTGDFVVIGADTVVSFDGEIMGKPADRDEAFSMLKKLQGSRHEVYTGVTLITVNGEEGLIDTFHSRTIIDIMPMTDEQINKYVDTGEYEGKAGGYAVQGKFAAYVRDVAGDYYNIVGLPVSMVVDRLRQMGTELL